MSAFLAFIVKYLPTIISLITTLVGLLTGGGAVASHFQLAEVARAAAPEMAQTLGAAYATHVYGQGAASLVSLLVALGAWIGQGHATAAFKALAEQRANFERELAEFQRLREQQAQVNQVTHDVQSLPVHAVSKLFENVKRLTGN